MTALELTALRTLPDEYVADGTQLCSFNGWVVVVNGRVPLPLIKWRKESGWTPLVFEALPPREQQPARHLPPQ